MNTQKKVSTSFLLILLAFAIFTAAYASTNVPYVSPGDVVTLSWSSTSPTTGDPVTKCTSKAAGGIIGVALTGTATADESCEVATKGVFDLSVVAAVDAIAIGDYIFASVGGINTSTTTLSDTNTGLIFGQALEAISSGTTDTIKVRLVQPSHL